MGGPAEIVHLTVSMKFVRHNFARQFAGKKLKALMWRAPQAIHEVAKS